MAKKPEPLNIVDDRAPAPTGHQLSAVKGDRAPLLSALNALDDEGWQFLAYQIFGVARSAGGFRNKEGWARIRLACDTLFPDQRMGHE